MSKTRPHLLRVDGVSLGLARGTGKGREAIASALVANRCMKRWYK